MSFAFDTPTFDNSIAPMDLAAMNKGVTPIFFVEPVENPAKSATEGRPIFDEVERVRIVCAGDPMSASVQPVTMEQIDRFPTQYAAFKAKQENHHVSGTPISVWPIITRARASELAALNIHSVENLAAVSDANVTKLGPDGRQLRAKAEAYLVAAKAEAPIAALAAENERMKGDLADKDRQISDLARRIEAIETEKPERDRQDFDEAVKKAARNLLTHEQKDGERLRAQIAEMQADKELLENDLREAKEAAEVPRRGPGRPPKAREEG